MCYTVYKLTREIKAWHQGYQGASLYQYCQYQHFKAVHQYQQAIKAIKTPSRTVSWRGYQEDLAVIKRVGIRRNGWAMVRGFLTWRGTGRDFVNRILQVVDKLWITWGAVDNSASFVFARSFSANSEKTGWQLTRTCYTVIVGEVAASRRTWGRVGWIGLRYLP